MRERVIIPLRRDMPRLLRFHGVLDRLGNASCCWCPLFSLVLLLAAHTFAVPYWWQALCDAIIAALVGFLFVSNGLALAICSILLRRPDNGWQRIGLAAGLVGGSGFAL